MDLKVIVAIVMPIVLFLLYALSERVKNRNQIALEIRSVDRGDFDFKRLISFIRSFNAMELNKESISEFLGELAKSSPSMNITIVNTGRVPITVKEFKINFADFFADGAEKSAGEKRVGVLIRHLRKRLPKTIARWKFKRAMSKLTETRNGRINSVTLCKRMFKLEPSESETLEIAKEAITVALNCLVSRNSPIIVYPSCLLVGEEKNRHGYPVIYSFLSFSLLGIELELPMTIILKP